MKNDKSEFFQVFEPLFFGVKIGYCIFDIKNGKCGIVLL